MSEKVDGAVSRVVCLVEHYAIPSILEMNKEMFGGVPQSGARHPAVSSYEELANKLTDLGEGRIAEMNKAGIDMQVLSLTAPGTEQMEPEGAEKFARLANEYAAEAVKRFPRRFATFAALPTPVPGKAADELEMMVKDYGFKGAMINGHVRGRYLDDKSFWPILERAEELKAPIYIHPTLPPKPVFDAYYSGNFPRGVSQRLSTSGWGWHIETATHALRLILSGAFDRYPRLQVIIGHLGEALPFMLNRIEENFPTTLTKLDRPIGEYFRENLYYTVSGFNFIPSFLNLLFQVGVDRIMFSADYPYSSMDEAKNFLERLPLSPADRERIAHTNAERLMHL